MSNKLKITIIGANGRTGIELVKQALKSGISVRALVRDKQKILIPNPNLEIIEGSPLNLLDVKKATQGANAVCVALNISRTSDFPWSKVITPTNLLKNSMENIVQAMKEQEIKRVLTVSAWGTGDSYGELDWMFRFLINKTNVGTAYKGHEEQEFVLNNSGLDWTAVRPVGLSNKKKHKTTRISQNGETKLKMMISRKDVAKFMLEIIRDEKYYQTTPSISNN